MRITLFFLLLSFCSFSQTWTTQSIGGSATVSTSPTSQFVIDEYRNALWLISDSTASVIENDGTLHNFTSSDLESSSAGGNMKFTFTSDHVYYSIKEVGLRTFDSYSPQFVIGLTEINDLFTDLDTVFMVTNSVLQSYHPVTGQVNCLVTSYDGNARKNGNTYINFGTAAYAVGPFTSVTLLADPTYLISPMNNFTFSRFTDSIYIAQETGISLAHEAQVYDTITTNNTINMPSDNVLDIRFDMNNNVWGIFGDALGSPFAIARLDGTNWIDIYTGLTSPINFSNFQGLEFDTLNNLWVAETFKLHTLNSPNTPEWLGSTDLLPENLSVFPNPARNVLNIDSEMGIRLIEILSPIGKIVLAENSAPTSLKTLDVSELSRGLYIARITLENTVQYSLKWQKK